MSAEVTVRRMTPAAYAGLDAAFAELSARAAQPNPHMAPAAIAAATLLVPESRIVILGAWQSDAPERLVGLWAMRRQRGWRSGFSAMLVAPMLPLYEVASGPVIDRDLLLDVTRAMLRHLAAASDLPNVQALPLLPLEGPGFEALTEACRVTGSGLSLFETWQRPVMVPASGDDAERYLRRALGQSYKKRMQQFRAIGRTAAVAFERKRGQDAIAAFERFLTLEAAGWKGKAGTAIACRPADAAYFRKLAGMFAARDALVVDTLLLDGTPIAIGVLIESAGTRHFLKIAYDETQSRHSPGRALTIAMLRADFAAGPLVVLDSGAGDDVDAGTYVWGERRAMGNAILRIGARASGLPEWAAGARMQARSLRERLRR